MAKPVLFKNKCISVLLKAKCDVGLIFIGLIEVSLVFFKNINIALT